MFFASCAWFCAHKELDYHEELSLNFTDSGLPCVDISVEGNICPVVIDLGSRLEMNLQSEVLQSLSKFPAGTEEWRNFRGIEFTRINYKIPEIKLGSLCFKNSIATEELLNEEECHIIWRDPSVEKKHRKTVGSLGRKLFKSVNLLFDIRNSKMIATNDFNRLKNSGYDLKTYLEIPFVFHPKGIMLNIDADIGNLRLLLDTGTTSTVIHEYLYPADTDKIFDYRGLPIFSSEKFCIKDRDFGPIDLYFLKMTEKLYDIDGLLGMDFIKEHVIYVDFSKNKIYIQ